MRKNKILITLMAIMSVSALCFAGCGSEEDEIVYGNEIGTVSGNVSFSGEDIVVSISNIKAYIGQDIDYLSKVIIPNDSKYDDMEVWVDASAVDIYTPGDYKATYTFKLDSKEKLVDIVVTILDDGSGNKEANAGGDTSQGGNINENQGQQSDGNQQTGNNQQNGDNQQPGGNQQFDDNQSTDYNQQAGNNQQAGGSQQTENNQQSGDSQQTGNNQQAGNGQQSTNGQQSAGSQQTPTTQKPSTTQPTSRREMITSKGNATTENKDIGYSSIELLSGKVVQVKSTTSKYIVATHTDVSYVTTNGVNYKVSKLTVVYNTGDTQVLETTKEKVN